MTKIKEGKIADLIQDDRNLNKGTEEGRRLIEKSLRKFGAGRSVLIDKNNRIIAGNKTHENAEAIGMDDVIIVETDGRKLVAVKRTDIDLDSPEGREMALADNATVKADLKWDTKEMDDMAADFGIDPEEWGISPTGGGEKEKPEVPFTEILGEEHNYVVLYTDSEVDWLQMQSVLDIGRVRELSTARKKENVNAKKVGIGRVMRWRDVYKKLFGDENLD